MGGDERRYVMICLKSYRYHHRGTETGARLELCKLITKGVVCCTRYKQKVPRQSPIQERADQSELGTAVRTAISLEEL